jgi:hypothetical protein
MYSDFWSQGRRRLVIRRPGLEGTKEHSRGFARLQRRRSRRSKVGRLTYVGKASRLARGTAKKTPRVNPSALTNQSLGQENKSIAEALLYSSDAAAEEVRRDALPTWTNRPGCSGDPQ